MRRSHSGTVVMSHDFPQTHNTYTQSPRRRNELHADVLANSTFFISTIEISDSGNIKQLYIKHKS